MLKYVLGIVSLTSLLNIQAFAGQKIYVNSQDIMIAENGIFVKINGYVSKTSSVLHDHDGTYITDLEAKKCPECGRDYPAYEKECPYREIHENKKHHCK